jgi:hypothetical protein
VHSNFKIGALETLKLSNKYNQLVSNWELVTAAFEKQQKRNILESAKLEKEVMETQRNSISIEGLYKISAMIYVWKSDKEEISEAEIHHLIKDMNKKDSTILMHVLDSNYGKFVTQYKIVYLLSPNIINAAEINIDMDNIDNEELPAQYVLMLLSCRI